MLELRDWQREAKSAVQGAWAEGTRCPTVVAPTGSGKTALAASLIEEWDGPVLFTAHRDVLIEQTRKAMERFLPGDSIGVIRAEDNERDKRITIASLQTLQSGRRLDDYLSVNPPTLVIADEAHISVAEGYKSIFTTLGLADRAITALGLSATLARTEGERLADLWDMPVYSMPLEVAIEQGILVNPRGILVKVGRTPLLSAAKDAVFWAQGEAAIAQTDAPMKIAQAIAEHCRGRAVIGFAANVRSAFVMARATRNMGLTAHVITANTPADVRAEVFAASEAGHIDVIWSVDTLSVGADLPWVSGVVVARRTDSRIWFVQAVGRGLRSYPGKTDCVVLEATSNSSRHQLDTFADLAGWEAVPSDEERPDSIVDQDLDVDVVLDTVEMGEVEYENFDFFGREYLWMTTLGGTRFLPAFGRTVFLVPQGDGLFSVGSTPGSLWFQGKATRHQKDLRIFDATAQAESMALQFDGAATTNEYGQRAVISRREASWRRRQDRASQAQLNLLGAISARLRSEVCAHIGADEASINRTEGSAIISIAIASAIAARLGFDRPLFSQDV